MNEREVRWKAQHWTGLAMTALAQEGRTLEREEANTWGPRISALNCPKTGGKAVLV